MIRISNINSDQDRKDHPINLLTLARAPCSVLRAPCSALRAPRSALEGPLGLSANAPSLSIETGGDYDAKLSSRSCSALEGSPSSSANAPSLPTETGGDCDAELSSPLPSSPPSIRRVAAALPLGSVQFCLIFCVIMRAQSPPAKPRKT